MIVPLRVTLVKRVKEKPHLMLAIVIHCVFFILACSSRLKTQKKAVIIRRLDVLTHRASELKTVIKSVILSHLNLIIILSKCYLDFQCLLVINI